MTEIAKKNIIPRYSTSRLIIKALERGDIKFLFDHYTQNEINRFTLVNFNSLSDAQNFYKRWCDPGCPTRLRLGIMLKATHKLIGTICYDNWSKTNQSAEIGYSLSPEYWGQGLMQEALQFLIQFGFDTMRLNRIEATTNVKNERSRKLLERLGFTKEGVLRQKYYFKGEFHDEIAFSLLKNEWKK